TYFPRVSQLLHNHLRIPEHTGVANAYGSVAGSVVCRIHGFVIPLPNDEGYRVHLPDEVRAHKDLNEAAAYAAGRARELALEGAERAGAEDIRVQVERRDQRAPVNSEWGDEVHLQTYVDATAVGRPRLAER
ncbi:MAG: hydantoinase/oxoprolinase family protein, partial [Chloroflexi bacterium]|nr:hydantoinase/oxoprolinase family protein [Chloroflexota bacterium]